MGPRSCRNMEKWVSYSWVAFPNKHHYLPNSGTTAERTALGVCALDSRENLLQDGTKIVQKYAHWYSTKSGVRLFLERGNRSVQPAVDRIRQWFKRIWVGLIFLHFYNFFLSVGKFDRSHQSWFSISFWCLISWVTMGMLEECHHLWFQISWGTVGIVGRCLICHQLMIYHQVWWVEEAWEFRSGKNAAW